MARVAHIGNATLYLADCREMVAELTGCDAVVTDGPYGIGYKVNARRAANRGHGLKATGVTLTEARPAIQGDDEPFDPSPWLKVPRVAFFGAQHFSDRLPLGRWLIWDKRDGSKSDDHSDCDLIWMTGNPKEAMRIHRQLWRGVCRAGEENCSRSKKLHPNQKPVALIGRIFDALNLFEGMRVADPYFGSGSTAVVALRRGLSFTGCEVDPAHFDTACRRLESELASEAA